MNRKYLPLLGLLTLILAIPLTVFLSQQVQNLSQRAAVSDNPLALLPGQMKLTSTFKSIAIEIPFTGDVNKNTKAMLEFKKKSETNWRQGLPLWGTYPAFIPASASGQLALGDWIGEGAGNPFFPMQAEDDDRYTYSTSANDTHTFRLLLKQKLEDESAAGEITDGGEEGEASTTDTVTVGIIGNTLGDDDVRVELLLNGTVVHSAVHDLTATNNMTTSQVTRTWESTDLANLLFRITHVQVGPGVEEVRLHAANVIFDKANNRTFYGSALLLDPNTEYDVRVTFEDLDGVATSTITGSIRTSNDNTPVASSLTPTHFVNGSIANTGNGSAGTPWKTIQEAFTSAPAGAIVKVLPGAYDYPPAPRKNPITLIGDNAVIQPSYSIAENAGAWTRIPMQGPVTGQTYHIWKATSPIADPNRVHLENGSGTPEVVGTWNKTRDPFEGYTMQTPEGATEVMYVNDMYRHGFFTFGNDIYVRLPGDRDPNTFTFRLNKTSGFESGRMVLAGTNSRVSGFTFNLVDLTMSSTADNLIIDNNKFHNATIFANANPNATPDDYPENILIENNDLRHTSLYDTTLQHNAIPWRWIKGPFYINGVKTKWNRVGDEHEITAIGGRGGMRRAIIRNNHIEGYFNGFGAQSKGFNRYLKSEYDIYNNTIKWIADDVFEPDGGGMNWRVWNNKVTQSAVLVSFGPAYWGPAYIFRNMFVDMTGSGVGKIVSTTDTDIGIGTLGFKYSGASTPPLLAYVIGNTYQSDNDRAGGGMASAGGGGTPEHFYMRNNIFKVQRYAFSLKTNNPGQRLRWDEDYNAWQTTDPQRGFEIDGKNFGQLDDYRTRTGQGAHSNPWNELRQIIPLNADSTLPAGSQLINAGTPVPNILDNYDEQSSFVGSAPDIGTCESGGSCFIDEGPGDLEETPTPTQPGGPTATPTRTPTPSPTSPVMTNTPTPTQPVATNTPVGPTNTPAPGTTTLNFTVKLHGLGNGGDTVNPTSTGNLTPLTPDHNLKVELYTAINNTLLATVNGTVRYDQPTGTYKGTITAPAEVTTSGYNLRIKSKNYLWAQRLGVPITSGTTNTIPTVALVAGDINNDEFLDILDYNILVSCYGAVGTTKPTTCMNQNNQAADLYDDGNVNFIDLNLWLREFSKKS